MPTENGSKSSLACGNSESESRSIVNFIQKDRLYHFEAGSDDDGVEERLRDVRVEVRHGAGEGGDVVRQAVVRVLQPAVQVGHAVEGLQWGFWVVGNLSTRNHGMNGCLE